MNSVEQAIRAALAKGNVNDPAFRQRIYGSASAALERSLTSRPFLEPEILSRRHGLAATIEHIEAEFVVASTPEYHLKNSTMVPPAKAAEPAVPVLETRPKPHKPVETPIIDRRGYDTEKRLGLAPSKRPF